MDLARYPQNVLNQSMVKHANVTKWRTKSDSVSTAPVFKALDFILQISFSLKNQSEQP